MIPDFSPPYPVAPFDPAARWKTSELLVAMFQKLDLPNDTTAYSYGIPLDVTWEGWRWQSHPFCWCEHPHCAYCNTDYDIQDLQLSAHAILEGRLAKIWQDKGFTSHYGAPNLRLTGPDGFDVRFWWYKHIGRDTHWMVSPKLTWEQVQKAMDTFVAGATPHAHTQQRQEALARLLQQPLSVVQAIPASLLAPLLTRIQHTDAQGQTLDNIQTLLDTHTSIPAINREGKPLDAYWRLKTHFTQKKGNPHGR